MRLSIESSLKSFQMLKSTGKTEEEEEEGEKRLKRIIENEKKEEEFYEFYFYFHPSTESCSSHTKDISTQIF